MKKINFFLILILIVSSVFGQQTNAVHSVTKDDYLRKSKHQKIVAGTLFFGGMILFFAGTSAYFNQRDGLGGTKGKPAMLIGGTSVVASFPLFILSSKNRKKSKSLSFGNQMFPQFFGITLSHKTIPSIIFKKSL